MRLRICSARCTVVALALAVLTELAGCSGRGGAGGAPQVQARTEEEKTVYALGLIVASNGPLPGLFEPQEVALICQGFGDAMGGDTLAVNMRTYGPQVAGYVQRRQSAAADTTGASAASPAPSADPGAADDPDSLDYALGVVLAHNTLLPLRTLFSEPEVALINRGLSDGILKTPPQVDAQAYRPKADSLMGQRMSTMRQQMAQDAQAEKARGKAFRDREAAESGARVTPSGLVYRSLHEGTGPSPTLESTVKVHYQGALVDGTVFDSSLGGEPLVYPLKQLVPGWQEGLQMMKVGGKARLAVPPELAYGDRSAGPIPAGSTLVFELELLGIQ